MTFDVSMYVAGLPFKHDSIEKHSLGGSETAGLYMAKALSALGCHVHMFCNIEQQEMGDDGVVYSPMEMYSKYVKSTPHDISIVQRIPEVFSHATESKLNVLWCHDLALRRRADAFRSTLWNVDKVLVLSDFMLDQYEDVYGKHPGLYYKTRNGIDPSLFSNLPPRNPTPVILYTARPERGLDHLLGSVFPKILEQRPDAELWIATYDNPIAELELFLRKINSLHAKLPKGSVKNLGCLTKRQLYETMAKAWVYVYTTPSAVNPEFAEVSCITMMECQAAGLPIVASDIGALSETIAPGAGKLITGGPANVPAFVSHTMRYINDVEESKRASIAGIERAKNLGWNDVAVDWMNMFSREISARNNDRSRLFRHLWRQSDIVAAKELNDAEIEYGRLTDQERRAREVLLRSFDFAFKGPQGFRDQYAKISSTHNPDVFYNAPREPRFGAMVQWMKSRKDIKTVLDYGCGLGSYAAFGAKATGFQWTGVDFDKRAIEIGREYAPKIEAEVTYHVLEHDMLHVDLLGDKQFDCAVMQEVLEHVSEPWDVAGAIEKQVVKDGWVYITVPVGPWEFSSYYTYPYRAHIWSFDLHDLRDMFGKKKDFSADALSGGISAELGSAMGWWIVRYRADHEPVGKINMARKLSLQRPRETLSVNIIAGRGTEDTLMWCLKSFKHIADEIIIGDCGIGAGADVVAMLANSDPLYGWLDKVRVVTGVDPKQAGFEAARNIVLDKSSMDWVLWIDTDERIVNEAQINKYLRHNVYTGYGIRQHHFACDVPLPPDMPVRFFRREALRFYGAIHEHPEKTLNSGPGSVIVISDAHIAHVGYLSEGIRQGRFVRNYPLLKLDQERYPERLLQKHFVMRDNVQLARFALAEGGVMDDEIKAKLRETIDLYRKHFLGKAGYTSADSRQYYSEALAMLGEGFDVVMELNADKVDAKPSGYMKYRYANKADLQLDLGKMVSDKTDVFESKWW